MKNVILTIMLLLAVVTMTACGSKASQSQEAQGSDVTVQPGAPVEETALMSNDEAVASDAAETEKAAGAVAQAAVEAPQTQQAEVNPPIDLDLTTISGTVVYSQVYDMMTQPELYLGQRIKMKGTFAYYQDPDTLQEYFAAVIADATACCAQGIEFVWKGTHIFPQDYPPIDTDITVTGTFGTYEENGYAYIQLADADVVW